MREQFCLLDQSVLADGSLGRKSLYKTCGNPPAHDQKINRANVYEKKKWFQKAANVWKKNVWDFRAFSQTSLEQQFFLRNEGKDRKNLNSQTLLGTPRRPSPRHPRPPDGLNRSRFKLFRRTFY